jgi:uncharacterized repeat protein (TIGR02543 family)
MQPKKLLLAGVAICFVVSASSSFSAEMQQLHGHVPAAAKRLKAISRLPSDKQLKLAIGLPLHNQQGLTDMLHQIYDPASPNFRHYLTPGQFTENFGPTEQDYAAVIAFARSNGFAITGTHPNRMLVEVTAPVSAVERAFHVNLGIYQHPKEARTFYAPDVEPTLDSSVPVLDIEGLNNYIRPRPKSHRRNSAQEGVAKVGTGPLGNGYMGSDFRTAYVPGVTDTGVGQSVALVEFDGFYRNDITQYENYAHISHNIALITKPLNGFNGVPTTGTSGGNAEVALDIEMAISMAPGLSAVYVYEEAYPQSGNMDQDADNANVILNQIAMDNYARQISCSWVTPINATSDNIFQQYAAQGQSFFDASGDDGAYQGEVYPPSDNPYLTQVGGTKLTTSGAGGSWLSETVWNQGNATASSGGYSDFYSIPAWQQGINMTGTKGSPAMRNFPDVAAAAENIFVAADNGQLETFGGTSCAAPLWAGFAALVNQKAASLGMPAIGFINPVLYNIGMESSYGANFHDITTGNSFNIYTPSQFAAEPGYDLCTGLGTPKGYSLINALLAPGDNLQVSTPPSFYSAGAAHGPFNITSQDFTLGNGGVASLNWSAYKSATWVTLSTNNGTLAPGENALITVSLNAAASNLVAGIYTASVWFTNKSTHLGQRRQFALQVSQPIVQNAGFETGDFSYWILGGDNGTYNFVDNGTYLPMKAHSGSYYAALGQSNLPIATLTQSLPTLPGRYYTLSYWLTNPDLGDGTVPNEFSVTWNGTTLYDQINLPSDGAWRQTKFLVMATDMTTTLEFGFRNDRSDFGLDDVSVTLVPETPPTVTFTSPKAGANVTNTMITVAGTALDNIGVTSVAYQFNGGGWLTPNTTDNWTNWSAQVSPDPGTNVFTAYAVDVSTNTSPDYNLRFFYAVPAPISVSTVGNGTVSVADGTLLDLNRTYTITATASAGFGFAGWTGSIMTNSAALTFLMTSNLDFTASFIDVQKPTLTMSTPTNNLNTTNPAFTVVGKALDNVGVANVNYNLNGTGWTTANSTNIWTNWNAYVTLIPGTNTIEVYAADASGNYSSTNTVSFFYTDMAPLGVSVAGGKGTVSIANGTLFDIGRNYSITATAAAGFKFTGWSGSTNLTNATLHFMMDSNLAFTANFLDISRPTIVITTPTNGMNVTNANLTVVGKALDNVGVANVNYNLNGTGWATANSTNNWTNWNAYLTLNAGTNIIQAFSADAVNNYSPTNTVRVFYVLKAPLSVSTNGRGALSVNYNGVLLDIGRSYSITATAAAGFKFAGWTGSTNLTNATLLFTMESNLSYTANFVDSTKPTLTITTPTNNMTVTNADFTMIGTAKDNVGVASVFYTLNGVGPQTAVSSNNWTNWTAPLVLTAGTNFITAWSSDAAGNNSTNRNVTMFYLVKAPVSVSTVGQGTLNTNYNGAMLVIGKNYSMTAKAAAGFRFGNWSGSTNTTNVTLTFMMESNLAFTATFDDVTKPTVIITSPAAGEIVTNDSIAIAGLASDNVSVAAVYYQIDGLGWNAASTTNSWTNWSGTVSLNPWINTIQAYAVDGSGNVSATASVQVNNETPVDWAPDSLAGMIAQAAPTLTTPVSMSFDTNSYSLTGTDTNFEDYGVGIYSYVKTGTNTAQLFATNTAPPPVSSNVIALDVTFTNANSASYSNTVTGDTGTITFTNATGVVPASLSAITLNFSVGNPVSITLNPDTTFTTPMGNSGNYTLVQNSPTVALLTLNFTDAADSGTTAYVQLTFSSTAAGNFFSTALDSQNDPATFDNGSFTLP